ncbi:ABC transporter permease subunit [Iocasia frigidifontis]|uniref:ABC transporter permease subunit n=1 Tax=Iocasia fonsfrigidae TaxID=2682810 RepID=A0A8A7KDD4_9FIRM|nr:carbohydrate ABC transporter permease [Iocasia fonsfrigidae]QTL97429.1 ABC transporter permease subunit [Iocasia fonsfrigidae]
MGYIKARKGNIIVYILLGVITFISLFPIIWMCIIAFKGTGESISGFNSLWINNPTLKNFKNVFEVIPILSSLYNSIFTTVMGTITTLFFCSLAGYGFAKYQFPGRDFLFYFIVATLLVPPEVGSIPLFIIMRRLHLINSLWSVIIPKAATAIGIFYMRQYIINIPTEVIESARIDGSSEFGIYLKIIVPMIKPALATWTLLTVIARWNDFFWPLIFLRSTVKHTLMVSISLLPVSDGLSTPWPVIMAGTTFAIIPVVVVYIFLQRFLKSGISAGAVKG